MDNWELLISGISLFVAFLAFGLSLFQFFMETCRAKREATLRAYTEIQTEIIPQVPTKEVCESIKDGDSAWKELTQVLAKIENFSVGINTGIYSLDTLNRLGGGRFIELYCDLFPIIRKKREKNPYSKPYDEFEKVVNDLRKIRKLS